MAYGERARRYEGSAWTSDSAPEDVRATWLDPAIMGPPICWLASRASDGITDQRIVATEFADHPPA
jgi:hypothetical protein